MSTWATQEQPVAEDSDKLSKLSEPTTDDEEEPTEGEDEYADDEEVAWPSPNECE